MNSTANFFKKIFSNDEIKISDDAINFVNKKSEEEKFKHKREVQVYNTILQNRNWKGKHLELLGEYRQMDSNYPIISAALKIFTQEACLTGDMKVVTSAGDIRIDELYAKQKDLFIVQTVNYKQNVIAWDECTKVVLNGKQKVYKVCIGNDSNFIKCTFNHKIKTPEGFSELKDLKIGDLVGTVHIEVDPLCGCNMNVIGFKPIVSIEELGEELVYDLVDVKNYHSFLIKSSKDNYVNVHNCSRDTDGNILKIHSSNEKIKNELEDLFFKQLKINTQSALIIKGFLKFGNHYSVLDVRNGDGVIDLLHLTPEMIRINLEENNVFSLDNFKYFLNSSAGAINFDPWEIIHFKYLDDIETLPYGQSILRSIVETYRRVIMMRDALIVYRITRAPQRLLFKIDTGNLDPDAAELHAKEIKKQLFKKPLINPQTGEFDYKYSPLSIQENIYLNSFEGDVSDVRTLEGACLKGDSLVRTTNGLMTIKEISEYFNDSTKKLYGLTINNHGKETNSKINWCIKTKTVNELYKITYKGLFNKSYVVEATGNHPFMIDDLSYVPAEELKVGQILKGVGNDAYISPENYVIEAIELIKYEYGVDVYDLEIDEFHNFALEGGIFVHNSNLSDVEDYKIIKDDLFAGLMIPKQYLQFDEVQTAKAALVQEDIRFANLIKQIQGFFIEGLLQIAVVHLHLKGYSKSELEDFTIEMNSNSTFAEKTRKELLEQRFAIAQMAWDPNNDGLNFMSFTQTLSEILKFTPQQIEKIIQDQFIEKKLSWRLMNLSQNGFYEETDQDKKERELEKQKENGVFNNIQFEHVSRLTNNIKKVLSENIENEIQELLKPVKSSPNKKLVRSIITENIDLQNPIRERLSKAKTQILG